MSELKVSFSTSLVVVLPDDLCINLFHCAVDHLVMTSDVISAALEYALRGKMSFEEYLKTHQASNDFLINNFNSDV